MLHPDHGQPAARARSTARARSPPRGRAPGFGHNAGLNIDDQQRCVGAGESGHGRSSIGCRGQQTVSILPCSHMVGWPGNGPPREAITSRAASRGAAVRRASARQSRKVQLSAPSKCRTRTEATSAGSKLRKLTPCRAPPPGGSGSQCVTQPQWRQRRVCRCGRPGCRPRCSGCPETYTPSRTP